MAFLACLLWGLFVVFVLDLPLWAALLVSLLGATAIVYFLEPPRRR